MLTQLNPRAGPDVLLHKPQNKLLRGNAREEKRLVEQPAELLREVFGRLVALPCVCRDFSGGHVRLPDSHPCGAVRRIAQGEIQRMAEFMGCRQRTSA